MKATAIVGLTKGLPAGGVLLACLLGLCGPLGAQTQLSAKGEFDFYNNGQDRVVLRVALDVLGVLARERASRQVIDRIATSINARVDREYRGGLYILRFQEGRLREKLVKLARELRRTHQTSIAQIGLVLERQPGEDPVIATDELIAQFRRDVSPAQIKEWNQANAVRAVMENPFVTHQYLLELTEDSRLDVLKMAQRYHESPLTEAAYPNFLNVFYDRETVPGDTFFGNQWHHRNTGQSGGTLDADADTSWAWDITLGAAGTVIAVLENGGYDMTHPDLTPNFWVNPGETVANGIDDDGNTFIDDINGWDFVGCTSTPGPGCGDNNPAAVGSEDHGTAVAGVAAARGNNALGVTGSCPNCSMMLLRTGYVASDFAKSLAFGYAQQQGVRIITNSWGGGGAMPNTVTAINTAAAAGVVVLFASGNTTANVCAAPSADPRVSLAAVIAVSSSSNQDRKVVWSAVGNCIDILAPSHRGYTATDPYTGTLNVTTTDRTGTAGYNNTNPVTNCPSTEPAPPPANDRDYTNCFGGTSSATPLTGGIIGLIFTVAPTLTRQQVQNLLQDTADRIEDSVGAYSDVNGFSSPATGTATHAWGRVNAFEAVRVVAPTEQGGKGGVDIFLRDNRLDWGNTEQPSNRRFEATPGFIGHWRSMDIKVDAPPYQPAPTAATFEAFVDETPSAVAGELNRVYVRVRNRGPVTASSVTIKLHWTQFGTSLPALPSDFWTAFPGDPAVASPWPPLNCAASSSTVCTITNLTYSGGSVAGTAADAAQIAQFDFPAPPVDPALPNHFCLLAMVDSVPDSISASSKATFVVDDITPTDNNVTHRNYRDLSTGNGDSFTERFFVRNPYDQPILTRLNLSIPANWRVYFEGLPAHEWFTLRPREERLVTIHMVASGLEAAEVTVFQELADPAKILGGLTYRFRPPALVPPVRAREGSESSYLIGAFSLSQNDQVTVRVINPTGKALRVLAAFFDDDERPLRCVREKLSANDLLEIEVGKLGLATSSGVVKVVSFHVQREVPEVGIVGSIRQVTRRGGLSETPLHSISEETLRGDLQRIWSACR